MKAGFSSWATFTMLSQLKFICHTFAYSIQSLIMFILHFHIINFSHIQAYFHECKPRSLSSSHETVTLLGKHLTTASLLQYLNQHAKFSGNISQIHTRSKLFNSRVLTMENDQNVEESYFSSLPTLHGKQQTLYRTDKMGRCKIMTLWYD